MAKAQEYDQNKQDFIPDFLVIPRGVWMDPEIPPLAEKIYAVVYWFANMKDGYCHATNSTIARVIGKGAGRTISRELARLRDRGYIHIEYNQAGDRIAIVPLHQIVNGGSPNSEGGVHNLANIYIKDSNNTKQKNSAKKVDFSAELVDDVHRLYKGWLIEMVIGSRKWLATPEDSRVKMLESAAQKTRLTEKRISKIKARLASADFTTCAKAIRNCGASEWHRGKNDRGWVATLEWLFHSDERIEEFANRKKAL